MSKRSGLSRWEDLKRWFIDVGRYRYILHKFDMERWRDQTCAVCGEGFNKVPNFSMNSSPLHSSQTPNSKGEECWFGPAYDAWIKKWYEDEEKYEQA